MEEQKKTVQGYVDEILEADLAYMGEVACETNDGTWEPERNGGGTRIRARPQNITVSKAVILCPNSITILGRVSKIETRSIAEAKFAKVLDASPDVEYWSYEPFRLSWQGCWALPDFVVRMVDGSTRVVEVKGDDLTLVREVALKMAKRWADLRGFTYAVMVVGDFEDTMRMVASRSVSGRYWTLRYTEDPLDAKLAYLPDTYQRLMDKKLRQAFRNYNRNRTARGAQPWLSTGPYAGLNALDAVPVEWYAQILGAKREATRIDRKWTWQLFYEGLLPFLRHPDGLEPWLLDDVASLVLLEVLASKIAVIVANSEVVDATRGNLPVAAPKHPLLEDYPALFLTISMPSGDKNWQGCFLAGIAGESGEPDLLGIIPCSGDIPSAIYVMPSGAQIDVNDPDVASILPFLSIISALQDGTAKCVYVASGSPLGLQFCREAGRGIESLQEVKLRSSLTSDSESDDIPF